VIPALLVIVTIDGPDAELVSGELAWKLRDMKDSGEFQFDWQTESVVVQGKGLPSADQKKCPWYG